MKVFHISNNINTGHLVARSRTYIHMYIENVLGVLWYLFWLYCSPIHFENHWNLFSDIISLCESVFCSPHPPVLCHYKRKLTRECMGPLMVTFSGYVASSHFKNFWNIFSDVYSLCESVFLQPSLSGTSHYKVNQVHVFC